MKASEIHPCSGCGGALVQRGVGIFYVVNVSLAMPDPQALNRRTGLTVFFGGREGLADAFLGNEDVAHVAGDKDPQFWDRHLLCAQCFFSKPLAEVGEAVTSRKAAEEGRLSPDQASGPEGGQ